VKLTHQKLINQAHAIARRKFGTTFPNPIVGCVIARNKKIISQAVTNKSGRPHAEELALKKAGKKAKGASMYVTLEPCFHNSIAGSCTDQILRSGIKEIFISTSDPDPRTNKKSIKKLKLNKVIVHTGIEEEKTLSLNKFFFESLKFLKPYTKIKMAISKDEKIAWSNYKSKWISNSKSRDYAHRLRFKSQAILTTSKTIIKDNPRFTIRKNDKVIKHITIIIIDKDLKIPLKSKILKDIHEKRIIIFTSNKNKKFDKLKSIGCEIIFLKKNKKRKLSLKNIFNRIYKLKIYDLLVEAGGIFFTNLLKNNLVNEIHIFKANFSIGQKGKPLLLDRKLNQVNKRIIKKRKFNDNYYYKYVINK
tara:strand:+ start:4046 stop:5131 length:1086 start_codon:yes stop_codon:yes gene_type:complete